MLPILKDEKIKDSTSPALSCTISKVEDEHKRMDFSFEGNKIHFVSLGCPRNLVDSEVMLGILLKAGYEVFLKNWKMPII